MHLHLLSTPTCVSWLKVACDAIRLTCICVLQADSVVEQPLQYNLCIAAARLNTEWTIHFSQVLRHRTAQTTACYPC
jgi:hypothetical protein